MKTRIWTSAFLAVVFVLMVVAGCSMGKKANVKIDKDGIHVETEEGTVDISGDEGGSIKVHTEEADVEISGSDGKVEYKVKETKAGKTNTTVRVKNEVDLDSLGVPIYPGAEIQEGTNLEKTGGEAAVLNSVVMFTTDPVEKVAEFYKEKLKGANVINVNDMYVINKQDGKSVKNVMIQKDPEGSGRTVISISVVEQ